MTKRKVTIKSAAANTAAKKPKKPLKTVKNENEIDQIKDNFTSIEFCKMLQDSVLATKGLQKFCQSCKKYKENPLSHDITKAFISVSPECSEVFKLIEKGKTSPMVTSLVFEVFVNILLRTASDLSPTYASVGVAICRRILQGHTRELYGSLGAKNPARFRVPALRALTAMVMQGSECAADVASNFDLSGNVVSSFSKVEKGASKQTLGAEVNIRLCFVRFVLSFFITGDQNTVRQVLEARGFVDSVFRGLPNDKASVIQLFLTTMLESVVKNMSIPKTNKVKLFAAHGVLTSVAKLFHWNGMMDVNVEEDEKKDFVSNLAYEFLHQVCCPFKHGINFYDREYGTGARPSNHVLHKFLVDLNVLHTDPLARSLVVEILHSCPDLLASYLTAANLSFEPRATDKWFDNSALVQQIYDAQPTIPPAMTDAAKLRSTASNPNFTSEKLVQMVAPSILPACFKRATLKAAIQHADNKVQTKGLQILIASLQRLQRTMEFITNDENWIKSVYSGSYRMQLKLDLVAAMVKQFPDIGSLVSAWTHSMKLESKIVETQEMLLQSLALYQRNFPSNFEHCSFDFTRLLHGVHSTATSGGEFKHAIEILYSAAHKYKWFRKGEIKKTSYFQLLWIILKQLKDETIENTKEAFSLAVQLAIKVSILNDLFTVKQGEELCTWLWQASIATKVDTSDFLLKFMDDAAANVAKRPHRYAEQLTFAASCDTAEKYEMVNGEPDESFWDNIPEIHIDTIDVWADDFVVGMNSSENKQMQDQDECYYPPSNADILFASFFTASMIEHLHHLDEEVEDTQVEALDRFLSCSIHELATLQVFSENQEKYQGVVRKLLSNVELSRFPNLLTLHQQLSRESPIFLLEISPDGFQNLRQWFNEVLKCTEVKKAAKIIFPNNLTTDALFGHDQIAESMDKIQKSRVVVKFAKLVGCMSGLLRSGSNEIRMGSVAQLCNLIFDSLHLFVRENLIGNTVAEPENAPDHFTRCTQKKLTGNTADEEENLPVNTAGSSSIKSNDFYLELSENIFGVFFQYFLPSDNSNVLWISMTDRLSQEVSFCRKNGEKTRTFLDSYFVRLTETLMTQQDFGDTAFSKSLVKTFTGLKQHLVMNDLVKIMTKVVANVVDRRILANEVQIIAWSFECLFIHIDNMPSPKVDILDQTTIAGVFKILINSDPHKLLTDSLMMFLKHFPTFSLLAENELLKWWCMDPCLSSSNLLKVILQNNEDLRSLFLFSLCDENSPLYLGEKHLDSKIEILLSVLHTVHRELKEQVLKEVKRFYWETLFSEMSKPDKKMDEYKMNVFIHLLNAGVLGKKDLKKFGKILQDFLQGTSNFKVRWRCVQSFLQHQRTIEEERYSNLRNTILNSLAQLAVQCFKSSDAQPNLNILIITALDVTMFESGQHCFGITDENWTAFVKASLKYQLHNPTVLNYLTRCVPNMKNMTTNATTVLSMLTTHSHFIDMLLQHNDQKDEVKLSLVQLLHKLVVSCDKSCLNARDFGYLLPAYHGTLSATDQCLLQIMIFYESNGMSMVAHKPFLFGNTALESFRAQRNASETLYKKPTPNRILACINSEIMIKSMEEFPIRRRMILHDSGPTPNFKTPTSDVYDPCFLVPALRELLLPENLVDCRAFLQQGALGYLYVCLSGHCAHLRNMAASCIARYYQHADAQRFSEKNLTLYVIDRVRNAVRYKDGNVVKLSTIMGVYLARITRLMFQPYEHMYSCVHRYLLVKPELDLQAVPDFYALFCSSAMEYKIERAWILDLIIAGMRDMGDFHTLERRQLMRILLSFYNSPTSDNHTRRQVMTVIKKCCKIRAAAFDLINNQAMLAWLTVIALEQRDLSALDAGADASKRQNATQQIIEVAVTIWESLSPSEDSANFDSGVQKELMSRVPVRIACNMLTLCFDLLLNLHLLTGATEGNYAIDLDTDTQCSFGKVLMTQKCCLEHLKSIDLLTNPEAKIENSNISDQSDSTITKVIRAAVKREQAELLHHTGRLLRHNNSEYAIQAAEVLTNWLPFENNTTMKILDDEIVTWAFNTLSLALYEVGNDQPLVLLSTAATWLHQWLLKVDGSSLKDFSATAIALLRRGYDVAYSMTSRYDVEDCLTELTSSSCVLLGEEHTEIPDAFEMRKRLFLLQADVTSI